MVTFTVDGYPAALVAQYLSAEHGIGVRDGRFCAHPLLARFAADGVTADGAGVRASLGLGSRAEDVDRLLAALASLRADGPAWTYAAPEAGYVPDPDPRALPDWLASAAAARRRRAAADNASAPINSIGIACGRAAPRQCQGDRCRSVPAVLLLPEVVRLLAGEPLGLVPVQVAVAVILEVLVDLGHGEPGQHLLAELVVLDDSLALAVVLVHPHRLEAGRAGQQLMRDLMMGPPAAVDLVVGFPRFVPFKKSHAPKSSPVRGRLAVVAGEWEAAGWRVQRRLRSLRLAVFRHVRTVSSGDRGSPARPGGASHAMSPASLKRLRADHSAANVCSRR